MGRPLVTTFVAAAFAALATLAPAQERTESAGAAAFTGAGSTFAFPILSRWSQAFQRSEATAEYQPVGTALDYEPVGSQAGLMRLKDGAVDFAATDVPLSAEELASYGVAQFPFVIGGVVVAANIEGVAPGQLKLSGAVLADIFLGKVRSWSDPAIKALNPDLRLPDAAIVPLRRADGSGTTYNFTAYLSAHSPDWRQKVGSGLLVGWPVGEGIKGNEAVAARIRQTRNAIGYVDYVQAQRAGLTMAALRNAANAFVLPSPATFAAAAAAADWTRSPDFTQPLTNAGGPDAYPIVATTYAVLPRRDPASRRARAVIDYFRWSLTKGNGLASQLGYVPLPSELVTRIESHWQARWGIRS